MKYILVSGALSNLGKGVCTSSIGVLLQLHGLSITTLKIDPYLNQGAGLISPGAHGECFITADGSQTDLDLGTYERALNIQLTGAHNITGGKIYRKVLDKEENGDYLGETVRGQHVIDVILEWIESVSKVIVNQNIFHTDVPPEVCIIEIGGGTGDHEGDIFLQAMCQLRYKSKPGDFAHIHLGFVPHINEPKTKLVQHSIEAIRSKGLNPDVVICRSDAPLPESVRDKLAQFSMIAKDNVFYLHNTKNLNAVPEMLRVQGMDKAVLSRLHLSALFCKELLCAGGELLDEKWPEVKIMLVGKYTKAVDAYLSIHKAIEHAAFANKVRVQVIPMDSADSKSIVDAMIKREVDGILLPGGFGTRGVLDMLPVLECGRTLFRKIPILGLCLGMQLMVIEYARNVLGLKDATSEECDDTFDKCGDQYIISGITESRKVMRLGNQTIKIKPNTLASKIYKDQKQVLERHRHKYGLLTRKWDELWDKFLGSYADNPAEFVAKNETTPHLTISGTGIEGRLAEIVELEDHPFYIGTQYHPEFKSTQLEPSPIFNSFIGTCARIKALTLD